MKRVWRRAEQARTSHQPKPGYLTVPTVRLTLNGPFDAALNELATALDQAGFDAIAVELGSDLPEPMAGITGRGLVVAVADRSVRSDAALAPQAPSILAVLYEHSDGNATLIIGLHHDSGRSRGQSRLVPVLPANQTRFLDLLKRLTSSPITMAEAS